MREHLREILIVDNLALMFNKAHNGPGKLLNKNKISHEYIYKSIVLLLQLSNILIKIYNLPCLRTHVPLEAAHDGK